MTNLLKSTMKGDQLNYLTVLDSKYFKYLYKFLDVENIYTINDLRHKLCQDGNSPARKHFQECRSKETVLECVSFAMCNAEKELDGCFIADFKKEQYTDIRNFKSHIQHLFVTSDRFQIDNYANNFLAQHLVPRNNNLRSLHLIVGETDSKLGDFVRSVDHKVCLDHPPLTQLMADIQREREIPVTLTAIIRPEVLRELSQCSMLLALRADDPFCQLLVDLRFRRSMQKEVALYEYMPELTEQPIQCFLAKLPVLQHLEISAFDLSNALLEMFISKGQHGAAPPLKALSIFADMLCEHPETHDPSPTIGKDTWKALVVAYPSLRVDFCLTTACVLRGNPAPDAESSAGNMLLKLLQESAPLVALTLRRISAQQFNDVVNKCQTFCSTLQVVNVENPFGNLEDYHFQELTSDLFTMKAIVKHEDEYSLDYNIL